MKNKFRTKKFWISLAGMVLMLLQLAGVKVDAPYVNEIINSVCAICVFVGLLDGGEIQKTEDEGDRTEKASNFDEEDYSADDE